MTDRLSRMRPAKRVQKLESFKEQVTEKINGNKKLLDKLRGELGGHVEGGAVEGLANLQSTISLVEKELAVQGNSLQYVSSQLEIAKGALQKERLKNHIESRWRKIEMLKSDPPKCTECGRSDKVETLGDEFIQNKAGGRIVKDAVQEKSIPSLITWLCKRDNIRFRTAISESTDFPKPSKPPKKKDEYFAFDPITHRYVEVESEQAIIEFVEKRMAEKQAIKNSIADNQEKGGEKHE